MTNIQRARHQAIKAALKDIDKGLYSDYGRHGARTGSLFSKYYVQTYDVIFDTKEQ